MRRRRRGPTHCRPPWSCGEGAERYVRVDITATNGTGRYVNASEEWQASLGVERGTLAERIFGVEPGAVSLGFPPNKLVPPADR